MGYRGSRSHHGTIRATGTHQYQNQYTPQQAYAAAQPYMAYSVDHFSQRGAGYGPSIDPYSMQQGSAYQSNTHTNAGGYNQEDVDQFVKGGKPRQQTSQQQTYGLQGSTESSNANANNAAGGWNNTRWVAANWQGN